MRLNSLKWQIPSLWTQTVDVIIRSLVMLDFAGMVLCAVSSFLAPAWTKFETAVVTVPEVGFAFSN